MRRILLALALLIPALAWGVACPTGYAKHYVAIVPHQNVGSTLTSFPVLLAFNGATITTSSFTLPALKDSGSGGSVLSSGNDIVACDSAGNLLNFDRAFYDGSTGKLELHVGVTVSSTTDTPIHIYIGKASDTDHSNAAALWAAANYVYVNHYSDGTTLSVADATGTYSPTNNGATATSGQIDGAANFVAASSQYVDSGNSINQTSLTMEAWVNPSTLPGKMELMGNCLWAAPCNGYNFVVGDNGGGANGRMTTFICTGTNCSSITYRSTNAAVTTSTWSMVSATFTGTGSSNLHIYINGLEGTYAASSGTTGLGTSATNMLIGNLGASGNYFNGKIDEVRIASIAQSADWEKAMYQTQYASNGFAVLVDANTPAGTLSGSLCIPYTIDHTKVPNTDRTNYQLTLHGNWWWMATIANGGLGANTSGYDLRWYSDSSCTSLLNFQKVYWSATTGQSEWRVLVPSVSHTVDTTVYFAIGNAGHNTDVQSISGTWPSSWINVMLWGDPTSLSTTSSGQDQTAHSIGAFTTAGSPAASIGPMGTAMYLPPGGTSYVNFTPGSPYLLSTYGYPVGSSVGTVYAWFKSNTSTVSQLDSQSGGAIGGYGCTLHAGGCLGSSNGARVLLKRKPSFGADCGMNVGTYDGGDPSISLATCSTQFSDLQWHLFSFVYTPAAATLNTSATVKFYVDGAPVSPTYVNATGALATTDGGTLNASEVNWGRDAAHGAQLITGTIGPAYITSSALSDDDIATYFNNESTPYLFGSWGTAAPVTSSTVKHKIVRH